MSDIAITDNLLSQYIADSATLSVEELAAVECYLTQRPEEIAILKNILDAMSDEDSLAEFNAVSNVCDIDLASFSDGRARELIDDILQEYSEEELFARFERECAEQRGEELAALNFENIDMAAEREFVKNISNK